MKGKLLTNVLNSRTLNALATNEIVIKSGDRSRYGQLLLPSYRQIGRYKWKLTTFFFCFTIKPNYTEKSIIINQGLLNSIKCMHWVTECIHFSRFYCCLLLFAVVGPFRTIIFNSNSRITSLVYVNEFLLTIDICHNSKFRANAKHTQK